MAVSPRFHVGGDGGSFERKSSEKKKKLEEDRKTVTSKRLFKKNPMYGKGT